MSAQDPVTREIVFTDASLAMAAARERNIVPPFTDEARRLSPGSRDVASRRRSWPPRWSVCFTVPLSLSQSRRAATRFDTAACLHSVAMDFLNVLFIKKIAFRKGCTAERTATIKYKHYVRLTGPDGAEIVGTRGVGLEPPRGAGLVPSQSLQCGSAVHWRVSYRLTRRRGLRLIRRWDGIAGSRRRVPGRWCRSGVGTRSRLWVGLSAVSLHRSILLSGVERNDLMPVRFTGGCLQSAEFLTRSLRITIETERSRQDSASFL